MLKRLVNHAEVELRLELRDPLLIKSGQATVAGVDLAFVRTYRRGRPEPFIPGSSLKGMFRAHAERICRTLAERSACLPYVDPSRGEPAAHERGQESCGFSLDDLVRRKVAVASSDAYRVGCAACRIFGSTRFAGRVAFSDGMLAAGQTPGFEVRDGIAIDRFTGGVAGGAKYDFEVLSRGEFETRIGLRNFERWQLGLLVLVLRDLGDGLVRLGSGKSRGLGGIVARVERFEVAYWGSRPPGLVGLWALAGPDERHEYGLLPEEGEAPPLGDGRRVGARHVFEIADWQERLDGLGAEVEPFLAWERWPAGLAKLAMQAA